MSEPFSARVARFRVAVIVQREPIANNPWQSVRWKPVAAIAGEHGVDHQARGRLIHTENGIEQYLWGGYTLELIRDDTESYWINLTSAHPSLFVICRSEGEALVPHAVSANYDIASQHSETEDTCFAVPIPPEIHEALEHYVVENYVPTEPRTRKKEKWAEQSALGRRPRPDGR